MEKLRVDSGIKKIEVNDAGEYICIPISDTAFYERFSKILDWLEEKQSEIEKRSADENADVQADEDERLTRTIEAVKEYSSLCKEICGKIDELFGEGCCRKVFYGIETPSIELIGDFFEQITPLLQKFANERNKKINLKYNRGRKGARSE